MNATAEMSGVRLFKGFSVCLTSQAPEAGEHGKLDFVVESCNVLNHTQCRRSEPVLWCGEFPPPRVSQTEPGGHFEAIAVLNRF
jgi:hypothetical protein